MSEGSLVSMVRQVGSWFMGSLISLLKYDKLSPFMYGKHGGGGGSSAILALCCECYVVEIGGGVPTRNDPINVAPSKEVEEGDFLLHLLRGVGRGSITPSIGVMPCSHIERRCGDELAIVKMSLYLKGRECVMVHNKLNVSPN